MCTCVGVYMCRCIGVQLTASVPTTYTHSRLQKPPRHAGVRYNTSIGSRSFGKAFGGGGGAGRSEDSDGCSTTTVMTIARRQ